MPVQIPVPISASVLSEPSTSVLSENADKRMKAKLYELRNPVKEGDARGTVQKNVNERLYTPASVTLQYPGLNGHQRRIIPIPISVTNLPSPAVPRRKTDQEMQEEFAKKFAELNAIARDNLTGFGGMVQQKSVKIQNKYG